jgi:hypothetical protein
MYLCMHACMYIFIHTKRTIASVCMYVCMRMYVHTHAMYVRTYVCILSCIHAYTHAGNEKLATRNQLYRDMIISEHICVNQSKSNLKNDFFFLFQVAATQQVFVRISTKLHEETQRRSPEVVIWIMDRHKLLHEVTQKSSKVVIWIGIKTPYSHKHWNCMVCIRTLQSSNWDSSPGGVSCMRTEGKVVAVFLCMSVCLSVCLWQLYIRIYLSRGIAYVSRFRKTCL